MSLLREIQNATTDPNFQLANILRMCKILATRLEHLAFKKWIEQELNGYKDRKLLPDYRILKNLSCRGDFFGSFGSGLKNAPIPSIRIPAEFREIVSTRYLPDSVSALESIVGQANQSNDMNLRIPWDADLLAILGSNIYEGMVCGQAWTDIPTAAFVSVLDTVKTRILNFVIEIEAKAPNAGEAEPGTKPIPDQVISIIYKECILHQYNQGTHMSDNYINNLQGANVGNIANNVSDNARQQANQNIYMSEQKKTLAEAANEIQQLLKQLEKTNPNATEFDKITYVNDETTPSFKRRVVGALQAGSEAVIEEFLDNPYINISKAIVKGWIKPE